MLLVFVKNPILGQVKTRIAQTIGAEAALKIYRTLVNHTKLTVLLVPYPKLVFYSHFIDTADDWGKAVKKRLQQGENLGERMFYAFEQAFALGGSQRVVIIGSDCLHLTPQHILAAFLGLGSDVTNTDADTNGADVVIGPATDGGYYLLGMNRFYPALLHGISWSTNQVLAQTLRQAHALNLKVQLLEPLSDVDTYADWLNCGGKPVQLL